MSITPSVVPVTVAKPGVIPPLAGKASGPKNRLAPLVSGTLILERQNETRRLGDSVIIGWSVMPAVRIEGFLTSFCHPDAIVLPSPLPPFHLRSKTNDILHLIA